MILLPAPIPTVIFQYLYCLPTLHEYHCSPLIQNNQPSLADSTNAITASTVALSSPSQSRITPPVTLLPLLTLHECHCTPKPFRKKLPTVADSTTTIIAFTVASPSQSRITPPVTTHVPSDGPSYLTSKFQLFSQQPLLL